MRTHNYCLEAAVREDHVVGALHQLPVGGFVVPVVRPNVVVDHAVLELVRTTLLREGGKASRLSENPDT